MNKWKIIQRLQRSPLTRWIWQEYQHDETGRIVMLPFWICPGRRYTRCNWKW